MISCFPSIFRGKNCSLWVIVTYTFKLIYPLQHRRYTLLGNKEGRRNSKHLKRKPRPWSSSIQIYLTSFNTPGMLLELVRSSRIRSDTQDLGTQRQWQNANTQNPDKEKVLPNTLAFFLWHYARILMILYNNKPTLIEQVVHGNKGYSIGLCS